jgi:hypothetical protein
MSLAYQLPAFVVRACGAYSPCSSKDTSRRKAGMDGWFDAGGYQVMFSELERLGTLQDNVAEFVLWEFKPL